MRLKSHIWVSAYLRRLNSAFISAALVHRGDSDAGAIYIKVAHLDGSCQVYAPLSAHLSGRCRATRSFSTKGARGSPSTPPMRQKPRRTLISRAT